MTPPPADLAIVASTRHPTAEPSSSDWRRPPGRRGPQPLLTRERHQRIVELLRAGAYDWVAAEAAGVGKRTYYRWLSRGESDADDPVYGPFFRDVMQAKAEARATAEIAVRMDRPDLWLTRGPGRTRPGLPGWTDLSIDVDVRLHEGQAEQIARVLAGVIRDLRLSTEQVDQAKASLRRHLAEVSEPETGGAVKDV